MKTFNLFLSLAVTLSIALSSAAQTGVQRALYNRERVNTEFADVTKDLSDLERQDALTQWIRVVNAYEPTYMKRAYTSLKNSIRNRQIIELAAHYFYTKQATKGRSAIEFYFHSLTSWFSEISENPLMSGTIYQKRASEMAAIGSSQVAGLKSCLASVTQITNVQLSCMNDQLRQMVDAAQSMINDKSFLPPASVMSYEGNIGGNQVELLTQNSYGAGIVNYLAPLTNRILTGKNRIDGKAYVDMSVEDFKTILTDRQAIHRLFTKEEGFPTSLDPKSSDFHQLYNASIVGNGEKNIFGEIYSAISNAKESVFIDIYFFGASAGTFMAKRLIDLVQKNPNMHVYMMTDRWNTMGYGKEMTVAYNFLRAYAEKFPEDRILLMPPNIFLKRTSLPNFVDLMISDDLVRNISQKDGIKDKVRVFPKAKSDHSKVIVVDGKNPQTGIAFVGSKNLTDTSGGVSYDEVAKVQGPVVPVILDSYYHDLAAAISLEMTGTGRAYMQNAYIKGKKGTVGAQANSMIQGMLAPIDVLNRSQNNYLNKINVPTLNKGTTTIQVGQNDLTGSIRTPQVQDIFLLLNAKKQIIISDQFLYDPLIIETLKSALSRNTQLELYVLLSDLADPLNPAKPFAHIPNVAFLADLAIYGSRVQIKWNKPPRTFVAALADANKTMGVNLSPEYHLKGISIDGVLRAERNKCGQFANEMKVVATDGRAAMGSIRGQSALVTGSANKDNMTMLGGFREFQLVLYNDKAATAKHDCLFWSRFDDADHSETVNPYYVNVPAEIKAKGIDDEAFVAIVRRLLKSAYNFRMF